MKETILKTLVRVGEIMAALELTYALNCLLSYLFEKP